MYFMCLGLLNEVSGVFLWSILALIHVYQSYFDKLLVTGLCSGMSSDEPVWSLRHHICSKIRVVGHQKLINFRCDRLLCCRWCSNMFIGYKKVFFSQHMIDGKAGGPIEKSISRNDKISRWPHVLLSLVFRDVYWVYKIFLLPMYARRQSRRPYRKK